MAEDGEIDIEGDFDFKLEVDNDVYDTNELPSKSANLLPEYTNPAWMLEQGWTMDSCIDEKSKATIEKMLLEEQRYYVNGKGAGRMGGNSSRSKPTSHKQPWTEEEKQMFQKGLEIYGRSWSKIAELIPSRTGLQVKNYAQQYFKQQAKKTAKSSLVTIETNKTVTVSSDPLTQVIASVTTAQPTVTSISSLTSRQEQRGQISVAKCQGQILNIKASSETTNLSKMQSSSDVNKKIVNTNSDVVKRIFVNDKQEKTSKINIPVHDKTPENSPQKTETQVNERKLLTVLGGSNNVQLSPTLEEKLASSTGIIENLDGFCAVADIITASGSVSAEDGQGDEETDIDIENDDDNEEENPVLQKRSASPNSVYERLLKAANLSSKQHFENSDIDINNKSSSTEDCVKNYNNSSSQSLKPEKDDGSERISQDSKTSECVSEDMNELSDVESNSSNSNESSQQTEKRILNAVVLVSGELVEFPIPTKPKHLDPKKISEEEKRILVEFFDGRASKTPERYLKIRNYILDTWKKCKPSYLNKTSVRPGLKNCGDVNCIGRVHSYLECVGAINFGCEQAAYNHPIKVPVVGARERLSRETVMPEHFVKLDSMRPRKRRIRDSYGHWVDEKELHGKTIEHKEDSMENHKPKTSKLDRIIYDPFKLIPCLNFNEEKAAPFDVEIWNDALIIMDIHAHVSKTEVIGMLGGQFMEETNTLTINIVVPCNSLSTGMQCEMDPVSQTQANEKIRGYGMMVVGWYHSHPTFAADPSVRDIETQLKFQDWFSKGGSKFVGIIVSPYNRNNLGLCSEFQCLTISDDKSLTEKCNIPYCFNYEIVIHQVSVDLILDQARTLAEKYSVYNNRVELLGSYRSSTGMTCLEKMLESIKDLMEPQSVNSSLLQSLRVIFTDKFSSQSHDFIDPDIVCEDDSETNNDSHGDTGVDVDGDIEQQYVTMTTSDVTMDTNNEIPLTVQSEVVIYSDSDMCEDNVPISDIQFQSDLVIDQSKVLIINEQSGQDMFNRVHSTKS